MLHGRGAPDPIEPGILRNTGQQREVTYITYRDRFAAARTVQRGVADDTFKTEAFVYLCDLRERPDAPADEKKPWELWKWPPPGSQGGALLLARATTPEQERSIGNQSGGRVFLFLETDDFERDYARMRAEGVRFTEEPRHEDYGTVVVFLDLYGNKWDLIGRKGAS